MTVVGIRGGLSVDHLVTEGAGARFGELGGPGLYGALGARLVAGTRVRLLALLPDDEPRFSALFGRLGIDASGCARVASVPRVWMLTSAEGRRVVETRPRSVELEGAPGEEPGESEDEEETLPPASVLPDLDGLLESSPLERPAMEARVVGIDPHQLPLQRDGLRYLGRVSPAGALVLPSRVQLRLLDADPRAAARRIRDELGLDVVARLDADGMAVVTRDGEWTVRDPDVRVVETTGAGDSSAAAIVAALAAGADLVTAAAFGVSVARLALSDWGHHGLLGAPLRAPFATITTTQERA